MEPILVAALLFNITAIIHFAVPLIYGRTPETAPVAGYGLVYLALGISMLYVNLTWLPYLALVLTIIGMIAAALQIRPQPRLRPMTILLILIDLVIIYYLYLAIRS